MSLHPDLATLARPVRPDVRKRIEDAIERMIGILDAIDGDPDLEPHLASTVSEDCYGDHVPIDDREEQCEDEGNWDDREAEEPEPALAEIHALDRLGA